MPSAASGKRAVDGRVPHKQQRVFTFSGSSAASKRIPAAVRCGKLSDKQLNRLLESWNPLIQQWKQEQADKTSLPRRLHQANEVTQREKFSSLSKEAPNFKSNGGEWKNWKANGGGDMKRQKMSTKQKQASKHEPPPGAADWWEELRDGNHEFFCRVKRNCGKAKHEQFGKVSSAWAGKVRDVLFAYAALQRRDNTGIGSWHCDGGASMLFLCISLEGERTVEIEVDADSVDDEELKKLGVVVVNGNKEQDANSKEKKKIIKFVQRKGDWYLGSPSSFWHKVRAVQKDDLVRASGKRVADTKNPVSTALILRTGVFARRLSGGREHGKPGHPDRKFSPGMVYKTKEAFEKMAPSVKNIIQHCSFNLP
mmetsp:Transcript_88346/g.175666  ORF Transcript_88346/g.175666 Transcript_88346/m.175666 type:complete len:367 (-) Transcript_88346:177-1277(-)